MESELENERKSKETIIATYQHVLQILIDKLKDEEKKEQKKKRK